MELLGDGPKHLTRSQNAPNSNKSPKMRL